MSLSVVKDFAFQTPNHGLNFHPPEREFHRTLGHEGNAQYVHKEKYNCSPESTEKRQVVAPVLYSLLWSFPPWPRRDSAKIPVLIYTPTPPFPILKTTFYHSENESECNQDSIVHPPCEEFDPFYVCPCKTCSHH